MIAKVKSKDGDTLYVRVKAKPGIQFTASQEMLAKVAITRSTKELLADEYARTPEDLCT
jgi:hypothetical protein